MISRSQNNTSQEDVTKRNRYVVFLAGYGDIHPSVSFLIKAARKAGFNIAIATINSSNASDIASQEGIRDSAFLRCDEILNISSWAKHPNSGTLRSWHRLRKVCRRLSLSIRPKKSLLDRNTRINLSSFIDYYNPELVIAIDKGGAALGAICKANKFKLVYYSLELYIRQSAIIRSDQVMRALWQLEHSTSQSFSSLIIQDKRREKVLLSDLGLSSLSTFHLPICEEDTQLKYTPTYWHVKYNLHEDAKILLYFGVIRSERGCVQVATMAKDLPPGWIMIFHGPCNKKTEHAIFDASAGREMYVSSDIVNRDEIDELICSCSAGLVAYLPDEINDRLTGLSSEKIALFTKHGKPIVALNYTSYEHLREYEAAVLIDDWSEMGTAVRQIQQNIDAYSKNARNLFKLKYDISIYIDKLASFFQDQQQEVRK